MCGPGQQTDTKGGLVHRWRHAYAGILVGKNTALYDNPSLTARCWPGKQPLRILLDRHLQVPATAKLFDGEAPLVVFNCVRHQPPVYEQVPQENFLAHVVARLHALNLQSVLVEGGAAVLEAFIDAHLWDEARVIQGDTLYAGGAPSVVRAPVLSNAIVLSRRSLGTDTLFHYKNNQNAYL